LDLYGRLSAEVLGFKLEEIEEKALDTENASALKKESVDDKLKITTFSKAEVLEKLFKDIPGISIKKAEQIFLMLQKFTNMKGKSQITEDDITKAYEALGLNIESSDIEKGCDADGGAATKELTEKTDSKKGSDKEGDEPKSLSEEDVEDEEEDEVSEGKVKKAEGGNRFDRIEKAIAASHQINAKYIRALGVMVKDSTQKLEKATEALDLANERINELMEINKAQEETISILSEKMEEFGNSTPAPKSLSHARPVERTFSKGQDIDVMGGESQPNSNVVSMSKNPNQVAELLDQATFAKGYDEEFSKACTAFEAIHNLPSNIIARMKNEYGVEIVK